MALDLARIISLLGATSPGIVVLYILVIIILGYNGVSVIKWARSKNPEHEKRERKRHRDALEYLFREARRLVENQGHIKNYQLVSDQMRCAEELIDKVKNAYTDRYIVMLRKNMNGSLNGSQEFLRFEMFLEYTLDSVKDFLRYLMRRNRLNEMSNQELRTYIDDNTKVFVNKIERTIDKTYPLFMFSVNRQEFYQGTNNERGETKRWFSEFIHAARDISIRRHEEVETMETRLADMTAHVLDQYLVGEEDDLPVAPKSGKKL